MEFQNFGQKSFVGQAKVQAFVDLLAKGRFVGNSCRECRKLLFPPKAYCTQCGSDSMEWVDIGDAGELMTFTTVFYGPSGFDQEVPYTLGVVAFPDKIHVFGQMDKTIPVSEIRIGMKLKVVPVSLGQERYTYRFEKV